MRGFEGNKSYAHITATSIGIYIIEIRSVDVEMEHADQLVEY
jgi:hypothetical protein